MGIARLDKYERYAKSVIVYLPTWVFCDCLPALLLELKSASLGANSTQNGTMIGVSIFWKIGFLAPGRVHDVGCFRS